MRVVLEPEFLKSSRTLPQNVKEKLSTQLALLEADPSNPLLHTKKLSGELADFYSFRVTRDWRVIFCFPGPDTLRLLDVGHRKDIYC